MPGAKRTRSLACKSKKARKQVATSTPVHPAFPHANGFNGLWRALPGDRALLSPSPQQCEALSRVDASVEASGPHAFAVREPLPSSVGLAHVHRILAQRLVTTAKRPFKRARTARSSRDDLPVGERKIFLARGLDERRTEVLSAQVICPSGRRQPPAKSAVGLAAVRQDRN